MEPHLRLVTQAVFAPFFGGFFIATQTSKKRRKNGTKKWPKKRLCKSTFRLI